ncbi:uncharacterized protein RMCT_2048 [Mycolicibacterium thermoresistibile]|uniref:Uncharacterized protein n=1 Tax=Mycolicibacterium thermoresistibile TaxID=1797 RepID=A0A100XEK1_MYCTH|nr:uncharacterized protein RMCT_2048 [Mycolicibacterium thermoresistibile]
MTPSAIVRTAARGSGAGVTVTVNAVAVAVAAPSAATFFDRRLRLRCFDIGPSPDSQLGLREGSSFVTLLKVLPSKYPYASDCDPDNSYGVHRRHPAAMPSPS